MLFVVLVLVLAVLLLVPMLKGVLAAAGEADADQVEVEHGVPYPKRMWRSVSMPTDLASEFRAAILSCSLIRVRR